MNRSALAFLLGASSIALAASAAPVPKGAAGKALAAADTVHCYNVHECKGNSDCKTAEHACKGHNACKGHGFKATDAKSCLVEGGTIGDL